MMRHLSGGRQSHTVWVSRGPSRHGLLTFVAAHSSFVLYVNPSRREIDGTPKVIISPLSAVDDGEVYFEGFEVATLTSFFASPRRDDRGWMSGSFVLGWLVR